jgi:hypothetical protein
MWIHIVKITSIYMETGIRMKCFSDVERELWNIMSGRKHAKRETETSDDAW